MSRAARRQSGARVGTVLADRFHLLEMLGEGGMAEVYRATDGPGGRAVAVKLLHADIASNDEAVERTKLEGELLSQLDNPAIVSVETFGQLDDGTVYLVMELLEGETLGDRMRKGPMEAVELAPIVAGTCAGLHAAHRAGVVHRDLKPDNIFLCPTKHGTQVKLLDFGISKVSGNKLTKTGEVLGTPRYMSPEQLGAERDVDARVDVYALGIILFEALAGQPPFAAGTPTDLIIAIINGKVTPLSVARPDVPPEIESVVMRALSCARDARYDTAMGLAKAYVDAVGGAQAVRKVQNRGMATRMIGSAASGATAPKLAEVPITRPPKPSAQASDDGAALRIGTFSGLAPLGSPHQTGEIAPAAQVDDPPSAATESPEQVRPAVSKATMAMGALSGSAVPAAPGPPDVRAGLAPERPAEAVTVASKTRKRAVPMTRATPLGMLDSEPVPSTAASPQPATVKPARSVPPTAMLDASQASQLRESSRAFATHAPSATSRYGAPDPTVAPPTEKASSTRRGLLIVGALLAGAISAGAVIGGLKWLEARNTDAHEEVDPSRPVRPTALPAAPPRALPEGSEPPPEEPEEPTPEEPEAEVTPSARTPRATGRRRARVTPDPSPAETPSSPLGALREAQQALRAGDADRCITLLDEAIRSGAPAISLRRRADCLEAAGRRQEAVRDYQRFCRLVPDNPAVSDVRARLAGWGQTCP
ncbi:MAG: protein kinase [Sandaracinaceae bacterium]